jgi:hypothetical protein
MATLADHLRALPDDGLTALLMLRTDLVVPVPTDLSALAVRAQSRVSVARALDPLDRFTLEILDAIRLSRTMPPDDTVEVSIDSVLALAAASRPAPDPILVRAAIDRLRARFLIYGPEHALQVAAGIDEVCPPYPAGLGRPAAQLDASSAAGGATAQLAADPAGLRRAVLAAPPAARAVLDRLAAGPPLGATPVGAIDDPDSPVGLLVAAHLLVPVPGAGGPDSAVELPREIGLLLRRDVGPLGPLHPTAPLPKTTGQSPQAVDSAGAGQAMEVVRYTEELLEALAAETAPVLKSGGLGIRDLRRVARAAGVDEQFAAALLEAASATGLLGETEPESTGEPRFLPTTGYDQWRGQPLAQRWAQLVRAWLLMPRQPSLVGRRDDRDRLLSALGPELERIGAPALRRAALAVLADTGPGSTPASDDVLAVLAWRAPRRFNGDSARADLVRSALAEGAQLGLIGMGALTGYGRLLLDEVTVAAARDSDDDPLGRSSELAAGSAAVGALDSLLPAPVDHLLLQADLTAVLPGPAEPGLADELELVGEPESANVYRLTEHSVRRALDAGYTARDLHDLFARRSRTGVPQALTYLIDDVARRHGGLRAGSAGGYLRSDDEALLTQLLADRRTADLHLRRLAPTVLASPYPSGRLLTRLREVGYAPVAEDSTGAAVLVRPKNRRAPARRSTTGGRPVVDGYVRLPAPRLAGIVEALRHADVTARSTRRAPMSLRMASNGAAAQAHLQAMAVLQQAVRDRARVWVGYVDAHGGTAARLVRPVSIGAGYLRAEDDRMETLHTFALHRITAAVLDEERPGGDWPGGE